MENNKLQELTQKLYNDGLEKGRSEADRLVAEAKVGEFNSDDHYTISTTVGRNPLEEME